MSVGRNKICACGSGNKYKNCCGKNSSISSSITSFPQTILLNSVSLNSVSKDIEQGYLARAEIQCREWLDKFPRDAQALNALGLIAWKIQMHNFAVEYFRQAITAKPGWPIPVNNLVAVKAELTNKTLIESATLPGNQQRFLVIKAWGFGFWSDVDHVLGGLLLAEITKRIPVIYWGSNSLFSNNRAHNAFNDYFEPVSDVSLDELVRMNNDYFPPKWSAMNLLDEDVAKWEGDNSRMGGLYFMGRTESVAVSDFYLSIVNLLPWIERKSSLYGLSIDDLHRYLFAKYLKPEKIIQDQIDDFYNRRLANRQFVAVHVRGSDKCKEFPSLDEVNLQYFNYIDKLIPDSKWLIFLLTDSQTIADTFTRRYGNRLVLTDSLRSSDDIGIHYKPEHDNRSQLGYEVMKDTYLAARADYFIGNGASNVSCMVGYLKNWSGKEYSLLVPNMHHRRNHFIYR